MRGHDPGLPGGGWFPVGDTAFAPAALVGRASSGDGMNAFSVLIRRHRRLRSGPRKVWYDMRRPGRERSLLHQGIGEALAGCAAVGGH